MDREDCMMAVAAGEARAAARPPEGPTVQPPDSEARAAAIPPMAAPAGPVLQAGSGPGGDVAPAQVIEALLFASDTPLSAARLAELAGSGSAASVRQHIAELNERYAAAGLSFSIEAIAGGFQMMTRPQFRPWLARLNQQRAQMRLSPAALETLAIVAYKQPIIRADVEAIRGVACGEVLNRLREMGLVRIVGRAEIVGRPMLYGTTRRFLDVFGLADLDDLPPMEALALRRPAAEPEPAPAVPVAAAGA